MKRFLMKAVFVGLATGVSVAAAQDRVARTPSGPNEVQARQVSQGQAAIQQATAAGKYAFVFFWKVKDAPTDKAWDTVQAAVTKWANSAKLVAIQASNPAEKSLVDRYGVNRAPMPMVLAIAPCGAVTKALMGTFDENQLRMAFVSPCTQRCLKAIQDRKLVLLCVVDQTARDDPAAIPQGVQDFMADKRYGQITEMILLNASDAAETTFLKELKVDPQTPKPLTVFLAPPGAMVGKFNGAATKQQLVTRLAAARLGSCPGGKCGPNGCGPKK